MADCKESGQAAAEDNAIEYSQVAAEDDAIDPGQVAAADDATAIPIANSAGNDQLADDKQEGGNNRVSTTEDAQISEIRKTIKSHIIVAALIATVTFAAGFTPPGGYVQSGSDNEGMAVLSIPANATKGMDRDKTAIMLRNSFNFFVMADSIAMVLSLSAIGIYFLAALPTKNKKPLWASLIYGYGLTIFAMVAMVIAFVSGLLAVLHRPSMVEDAIKYMVLLSFLFLFLVPGLFITIAMKGSFAW